MLSHQTINKKQCIMYIFFFHHHFKMVTSLMSYLFYISFFLLVIIGSSLLKLLWHTFFYDSATLLLNDLTAKLTYLFIHNHSPLALILTFKQKFFTPHVHVKRGKQGGFIAMDYE